MIDPRIFVRPAEFSHHCFILPRDELSLSKNTSKLSWR